MKPLLRAIVLGTALVGAASAKAGEKKEGGFDPRNLLVLIALKADKDGDGSLSSQEFRKVPGLKEVGRDKVDAVFAKIDADADGSLSEGELRTGVSEISDLIKKGKAQAKKAAAQKS